MRFKVCWIAFYYLFFLPHAMAQGDYDKVLTNLELKLSTNQELFKANQLDGLASEVSNELYRTGRGGIPNPPTPFLISLSAVFHSKPGNLYEILHLWPIFSREQLNSLFLASLIQGDQEEVFHVLAVYLSLPRLVPEFRAKIFKAALVLNRIQNAATCLAVSRYSNDWNDFLTEISKRSQKDRAPLLPLFIHAFSLGRSSDSIFRDLQEVFPEPGIPQDILQVLELPSKNIRALDTVLAAKPRNNYLSLLPIELLPPVLSSCGMYSQILRRVSIRIRTLFRGSAYLIDDEIKDVYSLIQDFRERFLGFDHCLKDYVMYHRDLISGQTIFEEVVLVLRERSLYRLLRYVGITPNTPVRIPNIEAEKPFLQHLADPHFAESNSVWIKENEDLAIELLEANDVNPFYSVSPKTLEKIRELFPAKYECGPLIPI